MISSAAVSLGVMALTLGAQTRAHRIGGLAEAKVVPAPADVEPDDGGDWVRNWLSRAALGIHAVDVALLGRK